MMRMVGTQRNLATGISNNFMERLVYGKILGHASLTRGVQQGLPFPAIPLNAGKELE